MSREFNSVGADMRDVPDFIKLLEDFFLKKTDKERRLEINHPDDNILRSISAGSSFAFTKHILHFAGIPRSD